MPRQGPRLVRAGLCRAERLALVFLFHLAWTLCPLHGLILLQDLPYHRLTPSVNISFCSRVSAGEPVVVCPTRESLTNNYHLMTILAGLGLVKRAASCLASTNMLRVEVITRGVASARDYCLLEGVR